MRHLDADVLAGARLHLEHGQRCLCPLLAVRGDFDIELPGHVLDHVRLVALAGQIVGNRGRLAHPQPQNSIDLGLVLQLQLVAQLALQKAGLDDERGDAAQDVREGLDKQQEVGPRHAHQSLQFLQRVLRLAAAGGVLVSGGAAVRPLRGCHTGANRTAGTRGCRRGAGTHLAVCVPQNRGEGVERQGIDDLDTLTGSDG